MDKLTPPQVLADTDALVLLSLGELTIEGQVTRASNATLYCRVEHEGLAAGCVYKPISGERPLWDFPDGTLAEREFASYLISQATGWSLVPPTVLRDGPAGPGMVQLWIDTDEDYDLIAAINSGDEQCLLRMALFDAVINNSDRKVAHLLPVLRDGTRHVYGIDHGVSFSLEHKLRTVLWQWAGDPIPDDGIDMLGLLAVELEDELGEQLGQLLTRAEVRATRRRVGRLIDRVKFPLPPRDWPAIPYPPY